MTHGINLLDRARIERAVWSLDQRLYDLPRKSRIAKRQEVRQNLMEAAADVGTSTALKQLGPSSRLAADYRSAEFGDAPRASWISATVFLMTATLFLTSALTDAANGFLHGVTAADPHASGTFTWSGLSIIQSDVTVKITNGVSRVTGGNISPAGFALLFLTTILIGRLWRVPATMRARVR